MEDEILSKNKKNSAPANPRLGKVGGQAVMEGVMMRSPSSTAIAVRRMDDNTIVVRKKPSQTVRTKYKILNLPIIRGIVNLVEMMILSFSTLTASTEMMGLDGLETEETEEPSKLDQWLDRHFGKTMMRVISVISMVLGVALALGLFVALPAGATNLLFPNSIEGTWTAEDTDLTWTIDQRIITFQENGEEVWWQPYVYEDGKLQFTPVIGGISGSCDVTLKGDTLTLENENGSDMVFHREGNFWKNRLKCLVEGVLKVVIFIAYLYLTSLIKDIKRVYQYHGAEHKSIFCYEKGLELTVENIRKQSRFHPRCGTSFMFVMVLLSILISIVFIPNVWGWWRVLLKIGLLPLCVGLGYEFIRYAGKHDNALTRALSAPGLWMQRITTREPDDSMIEVAIVSVKSALHEEFPDFEIPYEEDYLKRKEEQQKQEGRTDAAEGIQNENP